MLLENIAFRKTLQKNVKRDLSVSEVEQYFILLLAHVATRWRIVGSVYAKSLPLETARASVLVRKERLLEGMLGGVLPNGQFA